LQPLRQDLEKAVNAQVQQHLQAFKQQFKEQHQSEFFLLRQDLEQVLNLRDLDSRILQHLHDFKEHHQSELLSLRRILEQACDCDAPVEQHLQGVREQHQSDLPLLREDVQQKHEDFHATVQQISRSIGAPEFGLALRLITLRAASQILRDGVGPLELKLLLLSVRLPELTPSLKPVSCRARGPTPTLSSVSLTSLGLTPVL